MKDFWQELQDWYVKNGISTEQFFHNNSTEMGRDEMLMDFAYRMLKQEKELFPEPSRCSECGAVETWSTRHKTGCSVIPF